MSLPPVVPCLLVPCLLVPCLLVPRQPTCRSLIHCAFLPGTLIHGVMTPRPLTPVTPRP
jgi:hypothetical protein